ncbi:MAG TPA: serine/threonine-protein kinase [Kofleriaceae bacterium]
MTETRVSGSGRSPSASGSRTSVFSSLLPRFDERVSPDFYRLSGKLRAFANTLFVLSNLAMAPQVEKLGFDPDVHWRFFPIILSVHVLDLWLGVVLWRAKLTPRAMRWITYFCIVLEMVASVAASWIYGSVNSPFIGVEVVFIMAYRLAFDLRCGLLAFGIIFLGQWAVVGAEMAGVLPVQPIGGAALDAVYGSGARHLGGMVTLSVMLLLAFVVANWAVGRMRHKELAIRLLREQLHATEDGKIGRHTGRTLRDTYALGKVLGVGGMGEVYEATHLRTRRKVAVKMLHPHFVEDSTVLARFRREAEVTGKLGSDHIVQILDVDEDDGHPFLVLELLDGENLAQRIKHRGALEPSQIADVVDQIADALELAHRAGVVHRDLKPENVFLCPRNDGSTSVKLLDFGVSKLRGNVTALTQDVAILGTPDYMSPEQATGRTEEVDGRSDVFSLGGVIYSMLTTKHPFIADSIPALMHQICEADPVPIGELAPQAPQPVAHVVAIAMAKQRNERYETAAELARDLRAALTGTVDAELETRAGRLARGSLPIRRSRRDSMTTDKTHPA